ncbi:MAG TPA: molybdopterin cofactor-binding domain-containing protein [Anaerolineales bacterium]|nr:molybdopterin cofactor-binding domain-containing protein [Anaerolineales bacterium]
MNEITLTINGKKQIIPAKAGEMLASLLRERLNLTGTKIGCEEAECGTCTVLVDGEPVLSCVYPAARANGREIVTVEGLAQNGRLHALQEAFIQYGAVQCGFCIPGQLITAYALLKQHPNPSRAEIRHALKDTLCRCAGYPTIENSILAAARSLRTGEPIEPPKIQLSAEKYQVIGRVVMRPDAEEKVTGQAKYSDDLKFDGMLYAAVKRCGIPHGFLRRLDISKAQALVGVEAVLTAADIPGEHNHGLVIYDWPAIVGIDERVRYVGDAVAIVAARSQEIAEEAVGLIEAEYELQAVITSAVQARQADVPDLHKSGNLLKHIKVRKGNMEQGFADADVVMEHVFQTAITEHAFLEPECSIAVPLENGRMEIYVGSQIPYQDREQVARILGWPEDRVRIVGQLMGGGFGGKEDIAGQVHAALLSNVTHRPVKLLFDRHESLLVHPKRHATQIRVKVGAKKNGCLTAVETELYGDTGAYASLGEKVMTRATTHSAGPYEVPHVRADCYAMYTNNPPAGAFRGFGVTQSAFAVESMMDMLAEKLRMDRVELRRINALHVGSVTNTGQVLRDSVGLTECIDKVEAEMFRLSGTDEPFGPRPVADAPHLIRSWGYAVAYKNTGLGGGAPDKSGVEVELYKDGCVEVRTSAAELGQGLVTVLRMIVAEELSMPPEKVRVLVMDTDLTPDGGPTTASRQTYVTGNAARMAAKTLRAGMTSALAEKYDQPPEKIRYIEGLAQVDGHSVPLSDVYVEMKSNGQEPRALYEYWAPETKPLGEGGDMHVAFSYAAQAAEVEVNTNTGEVRVLNVIAATDVGRIINPLGLEGQVEGGVMMGLGNALTENFIVEDGHVVTDRLARYRMPGIAITPNIIPIMVEHPAKDGPYGAKGVGEIVSIPTTPAITNAIYNAVGVRVDSLPVDQEQILWGLQKAIGPQPA